MDLKGASPCSYSSILQSYNVEYPENCLESGDFLSWTKSHFASALSNLGTHIIA